MLRRLIVGFGLSLSASALAQESASPTSAPAPSEQRPFEIGIDYRIWTEGLSPYPIQPNGETLGQFGFVEHRLRVDPIWKLTPRLRLVGRADLLTGLLAGQTTDLIFAADEPRAELDGLTTAEARQLFLEYRFLGTPEKPGGVLRAGLQASEFGSGMLTNSGQGNEQDWGLKRFGDESFRLLLGSRPVAIATNSLNLKPEVQNRFTIPWQLVLAADLVRNDNLAVFSQGDIATQGVVALQYITEPLEFAVYGAQRHQEAPIDEGDADAETLDVRVYDFFLKTRFGVGDSTLYFVSEGAFIQGSTTLNRSEDNPDGTQIQQLGGLARFGVKHQRTEIEVEGGYAQGDSNPQDGTVTNFSMNRDYNVSLLLFEEVLASQTARDSSRAQDPNTVGIPPDGVELLPTNGAVTGATYGKLTWRYQSNQDVKIIAALLYAHATADLVAAFASFENGGVPTNYLGAELAVPGAKPRRALGTEADLGVSYKIRAGRIPIELRAQAGLFVPGIPFQPDSELNYFVDGNGNRMGPVFSLQSGLLIPANIIP